VLGAATVTAFLATTNGPRSKEFFGRVLGLRLNTEDDFALVFDAGGVELRIQKVKTFVPHPFTALGWQVRSIGKTIAALTQKGIHFERYPFLEQDKQGIWKAPSGARVAWFKDPDGNLLSLTEMGAP